MTRIAPPARIAALAGGRQAQTRAQAGEGLGRAARAMDGLVVATDGLLRRIEAVWNEAPETLAVLAEWSDTLQAQRREVEDWQRSVGHRPVRAPRLGRVLHDTASDIGLLGRMGRRVEQVVRHGGRLRNAQADAAARTPDARCRAMLERHAARTERHIGRLRERMT